MRVINLTSGPGAGKSTLAAGLFYNLKMKLVNAELVTEYAKDLTWDERENTLKDQLYVFAKQHQRLNRLRSKVEIAVTDSPLILSMIYVGGSVYNTPAFESLVVDRFKSFQNLNFFIERVKPYIEIGRSQTEDQARQIDQEIKRLFQRHSIPYEIVKGDEAGLAYLTQRAIDG